MKKSFIFVSATLKAIIILSLTISSQVWSYPYSEIYVFGDSLSDTGRLFKAIGTPPAPYFKGRVSNGKLWIEYLSKQLNLSYQPQTNFAWAGATTGTINVWGKGLSGLQQQVESYLKETTSANPKALYVVWAGANDFSGNISDPQKTIITAVTNITTAVSKLRQHGAQQILVPNLPDIGNTPRGKASGMSAVLTNLTITFNHALAKALKPFNVIQVDIPASFELLTKPKVITPPFAYLSNVTDACFDKKSLTVCKTPSQDNNFIDKYGHVHFASGAGQ